MDFFDDDFGLGTGNSYTRKPSVTSLQKGGTHAVSNSPRKSPKKDPYADELFDLLNKDEKRSVRKSERDIQPFSSTMLEPNQLDFKRTEKWSAPNIQVDALYQPPKFHNQINPRKDSFADSEDGRSFKSGVNNKVNNYELDNLITLRPIQSKDELPIVGSMRSMMKPPLRKRQSKDQFQDYKQPSIVNEDQSGLSFRKYPETTGFLDFGSRTDLRPKKEQKNFAAEQKEIVLKKDVVQDKRDQRKSLDVGENVATLKKQFETEIKQIKQAYQRQLKSITDKLKQQIESSKMAKTKITNEYEERIIQEKKRWQSMLDQTEQRLKKMHEWEMNKKCEAYDMEIQKLKSMAKVENMLNNQQSQLNSKLEHVQLKTREHQLGLEKKKLDDVKIYLEQREREVQYYESNFDIYRKKQQQAMQTKLKSLMEKENQLRKQEMEGKRILAFERQKIAAELTEAQMDIIRKQQSINLEKQQTRIMKQMFERQKTDYSQFNKKLLNDYKDKLQEIQAQKSQLNNLEMELHNKLNTVEIVGKLKKSNDDPVRTRAYSKPSVNQENSRNRTNTDFSAKIKETKDRFKEMQVVAKNNCIETLEERQKSREGAHLSLYITRLNKMMSKH